MLLFAMPPRCMHSRPTDICAPSAVGNVKVARPSESSMRFVPVDVNYILPSGGLI